MQKKTAEGELFERTPQTTEDRDDEAELLVFLRE